MDDLRAKYIVRIAMQTEGPSAVAVRAEVGPLCVCESSGVPSVRSELTHLCPVLQDRDIYSSFAMPSGARCRANDARTNRRTRGHIH
eukprot:scaffold7849_cov457-Prasinococcus_capsulatus_cf.AAC.13